MAVKTDTLVEGPIRCVITCLELIYWLFISTYKHIFCIIIFYIPNPTQYLNLTTPLLTINMQQTRSILMQKLWLMVC